MSTLTTEEAKSLCKAHQSQFDAISSSTCRFLALVAADQAQCEQLLQSCNDIQTSGSGSSIDCDAAKSDDLKGCDLTVGEMSSCLDQMASFLGGLSCAQRGTSPKLPECSSTLSAKCPSLFGDATPTMN